MQRKGMCGLSKNGDVLFPDGLDERSFFSDIGLDDKQKLFDHNTLIKARAYKRASEYAESTGHEYYGAYLFNAMEGRVKNIGEYALTEEVTRIRPYYQEEEPGQSEYYDNLTWISSSAI